MHKLHELKDKLIEELEAYAEMGKYSKDDVESIKYISSAIDHICNIMDDSDDYSGRMMMPYAYDDGMSYARGRRGNVRRDSMGRYSSASDEMVHRLRDMVHDAPDASTRHEIENLITKLERMK